MKTVETDALAQTISEKTPIQSGFLMMVLGAAGGGVLSSVIFVLGLSAKVDMALASASQAQSMAAANANKIDSRADLSNTRYIELTNRMTSIEVIVKRIDSKL